MCIAHYTVLFFKKLRIVYIHVKMDIYKQDKMTVSELTRSMEDAGESPTQRLVVAGAGWVENHS